MGFQVGGSNSHFFEQLLLFIAKLGPGSPADFAGEASGAAEQLANLSGYDFIVLGGGKCTSRAAMGWRLGYKPRVGTQKMDNRLRVH